MMRKLLRGRTASLVLLAVLLMALVPIAVWATVGTSTPFDIVVTGTEPTFTQAVTDGIEFANNGRVLVIVRSAETTSTTTVWITTAATFNGWALEDATFDVAAGRTKIAGPFPTNVFNDSDGNVTIVAVEGNGFDTSIAVSVTTVRF